SVGAGVALGAAELDLGPALVALAGRVVAGDVEARRQEPHHPEADRVDPDRGHQVAAPAVSCVAFAASIRATTSRSRPSRTSSIGSRAPVTLTPKDHLRSWEGGHLAL